MKSDPHKPSGHSVDAQWDGMNFMERLDLILQHAELFWSLRLITASEIAAIDATHLSDREYMIDREEQPFFTSLQIKETVAAQQHRDKLMAALRAVFM